MDKKLEELKIFVQYQMNLHSLEESLILQPVLNKIYELEKEK